MRSATELKQIFQEGWNTSTRVDNYVRNVAEFTEGECFQAWCKALTMAMSAAGRLKSWMLEPAQESLRDSMRKWATSASAWTSPTECFPWHQHRKHAVGLLLCLR